MTGYSYRPLRLPADGAMLDQPNTSFEGNSVYAVSVADHGIAWRLEQAPPFTKTYDLSEWRVRTVYGIRDGWLRRPDGSSVSWLSVWKVGTTDASLGTSTWIPPFGGRASPEIYSAMLRRLGSNWEPNLFG